MRVLLADDETRVIRALRVMLDSWPSITVLGSVEDAPSLLALLRSVSPDVLILDWQLPGLPKAGSIKALKAVRPEMRIIAISGRPEFEVSALAAGADAFVSKIDSPDRLVAILDHCQTGTMERLSDTAG